MSARRSIRRLVSSAVAIAVSAAVLVGCADGGGHGTSAVIAADRPPLTEVATLDDPKAYEGPSTATLGSFGLLTVDPGEPALPATVTSHDPDGDTEVTVDDTSRIIALSISGGVGQTVSALGFTEQIVGRDISTAFPGSDQVPVVTRNGHSLDIESLLALQPTVVITDGSIGPLDVLMQVRDAGIALVFTEQAEGTEDIATVTGEVAAALGVPDAGARLGEAIDASIADTVAQVAEIAPTGDDRLRMVFLYLRGGSGVYYLFGEESGATSLIESLGGVDVLGEMGWRGEQPMTDEAMIAADPDLILVMTGGIESVGGVDGLLAEKPAIAITTAGEHRRFVDMADTEVLSFGPSYAAVIDALARAIYAPDAS